MPHLLQHHAQQLFLPHPVLLTIPPEPQDKSTYKMKLLSSTITTLTLLTSMALTSPTPANLIPRACTTITPTAIDILDSANPDTPSISQQFSLSRTATTNTKISALTF